ncbi:MAG: PepSY domain-containing protein, partial [Pseudomonadota bacterium]
DEIEAMRHPVSGELADRVIIQNWQDQNAVYDVLYTADTKLSIYDSETINGATGAASTSAIRSADSSPANRVTAAVTPLHYGTFGGIALKLVYLLLGLSLAIITAMGNMMWIERRLHGNEGNKSEAFYRRLGRLTVGVTTGLPLASVAIFYLDKLYGGAEAGRLAATGWTYFGVWVAVIIFALARRNDYRTVRDLLALTGIVMIGLPILNGVATGEFFWSAIGSGHTASAWVDFSCLILGVLTVAASRTLPSKRPERQRRKAAAVDGSDGVLSPAE